MGRLPTRRYYGKTPETVFAFLDKVADAVLVQAKKETSLVAEQLEASDGITDMKSWDVIYGINLLKSHLLPGFDPKDARQYFAHRESVPGNAEDRTGLVPYSIRADRSR